MYGDVPPSCDGHLAGDDFAGMVDSVRFAQTDVKLADFIHRADRSLSVSLIVFRQLFLRFHASIEAAHSSLVSVWEHTQTQLLHLINRDNGEVSVFFATVDFFLN